MLFPKESLTLNFQGDNLLRDNIFPFNKNKLDTNLLRSLWDETVTLAEAHTICTRTARS